jgi:hypothetical protein
MAEQASIVLEYYEFNPDVEAFTATDMVNILKAMKLTFHSDAWARLDEESRKHFMVRTRSGESYQYGKKPKRQAMNRR